MTREEREIALYCLKAGNDYHSEVCEECVKYPNCDHTMQDDVTETIIKALEQEPCEDAISRQDTLKTIIKHLGIRSEEYLLPAEEAIYKVVKNMPSVTPKQKMGKWKFIGDCMFECSSCKMPYTQQQLKYMCNYTYEKFPMCCPNCGAKNGK